MKSFELWHSPANDLTCQTNQNAYTIDSKRESTVDKKGWSSEWWGFSTFHKLFSDLEKKQDSGDEKKKLKWRVNENKVFDDWIMQVEVVLIVILHSDNETFEGIWIGRQGRRVVGPHIQW